MTKKDYELIARAFARTFADDPVDATDFENGRARHKANALNACIKRLSFDFALDNARFDADKFEYACRHDKAQP